MDLVPFDQSFMYESDPDLLPKQLWKNYMINNDYFYGSDEIMAVVEHLMGSYIEVYPSKFRWHKTHVPMFQQGQDITVSFCDRISFEISRPPFLKKGVFRILTPAYGINNEELSCPIGKREIVLAEITIDLIEGASEDYRRHHRC